MNFSIDYGTFQPAARPQDPTLYASIEGRVSSLGNGEVVFFDPASGVNHVMTLQVLQAMDQCRPFRTLDQHVAQIAESQPELKGQHEAIRRVLQGLVSRGLIVSDAAFLARFATQALPAGSELAGVFIRACDRPTQLKTLLASLIEYEKAHGRGLNYVVVDDSTQAAATREHANLVRDAAAASGCQFVHVDASRWSDVAQSLLQALPEHRVALERLLTRSGEHAGRRGGGIGKNLISLLAAGGRYVLLDDDFVFPIRRHPEYVEGLCFDARAWGIRTYPHREAAMDAGRDSDGDPLSPHLAACGATLGQLLRDVDGCEITRAVLQELVPSRTAALRPEARVALTVNGHRGASGASNVAWLYLLDPAARAGLAGSRESYLESHGDPNVWFGMRAHLLSTPGNFTPFCVDNRALMPCTSPFGRSEDVLFGALVNLADANAYELNFPSAIGHAQEGRRDRSASLQSPETPDINLCFAEMARQCGADAQATDRSRRLALFASRVEDLAHASEASVSNHLSEFLAFRRSGLIEQLQATLAASADAPVYWSSDLRRLVEVNGRALVEKSVPRFAGWAEDADEAECVRRFRIEAQSLAEGLRAWPAAWDVALKQGARWLDPPRA